jgi:hypothetical protein
MGWNHDAFAALNVSYWRTGCSAHALNDRLDDRDRPLASNASLQHRIGRLAAVVGDVERAGFFDWHLFPQAAFLRRVSGELNFIGDVHNLTGHMMALTEVLNMTEEEAHADAFKASMSKDGNPWTVTKRELLGLAAAYTPPVGDPVGGADGDEGGGGGQGAMAGSDSEGRPGARDAWRLARRICMLAAVDYHCLPYDPPAVCAGLLN